MQQQDIMNVLLYDMSRRRMAEDSVSAGSIINEVIDGWNQNKYVFPQQPIKFKKQVQKTYRLM